MQRCRLAGLAAAVLASSAAAGARAEGETTPPAESQPAPARTTTTTTQVVSTEAGGTEPSEPTPPNVSPAPLPAPPSAPPPSEPTLSNGAPSSEPPAPSEYDQAADTDPAALNDFRDTLSPYGTWEEDATYGVVWVPSNVVVGADFAPYVSHGHWGLSGDNSWLWVSDFSWGWAPFHYGRWTWIGGRGWGWIPGRVYSPAWVVWRTGFYDDYYVGWAPMPPTWYWRRGGAFRLGFAPAAPYVFCSATHVFAPHVRTYLAPPGRVGLIGPRTRPYVAAAPSMVGAGHSAITMTRGPSLADAHVPMSSVPVHRAAPDARAVSFAQMHPPSRAFASPQADALRGRGDIYGRPSTSGIYTTRPSGASPQIYSSRPLSPAGAPAQPVMPTVPRPTPAIPRSYSPPSAPFGRPSPGPVMPAMPRSYPSSAPFTGPSSATVRPYSPAPVVRSAAPPANFARPSAPSVSRPSAPAAGRPAAAPRNFSR